MEQSLEQLKQENAIEEAKLANEQSTTETETAIDNSEVTQQDSSAAVNDSELNSAGDTDSSNEENAEEEHVELWMQDEEQTSLNDDNQSFDSSDMAKLRRKLKAKSDEKDDEIAQLKADIELMKSGVSQPAQAPATLARPKLEDFDYDEDKYNASLDDYYMSRMSQQTSQAQAQASQQQQQQQAAQIQQKKLDSHYEQVSELIASRAITPEMYQNSEVVLRKALDNVSKGNGDNLTDTIIAQLANLGDGGAKVITHLGRNSTNRNKLVNALAEDPTGLTMMGMLGELKAKLTSAPAKKISSAPKPTAKLSGGEPVGDSSAKLSRKYAEAHKRGDAQAAFNIKQEAKKAGIQTRNWN